MLFDVEYYRDLEMWVRGHSRSLKMVPFESLDMVFYSPSIVIIAVPFRRYSASKNGLTLKYGFGVVQGHWKWRGLIDNVRLSINWSAIITIALSCTIFELFDVE